MRITRIRLVATVAAGLLALSACGGGGGSSRTGGTQPPPPPPPPPPAISEVQAARFLTQASFSPTRAEIARVRSLGYEGWIDEQLDPARTPITLMRPHLEQVVANGLPQGDLTQQHRRNAWLWFAATKSDQLRMRMAFALSEIMVVSDQGSNQAELLRMADYQDTLARNAFGSYRALIEAVSLHPAMGSFLSHAGNRKASADGKIVPGSFTVMRSGGNTAVPLEVQVGITGTAAGGVDYVALSQSVTSMPV